MAARIKNNPVERMKLVVVNSICGAFHGSRQLKPFNPILGETLQGYFPDGTKIDVEHTSHHPPISHFYVQDYEDKYRMWGYYEYKGKVKPTSNCIEGGYIGPMIIKFMDDNSEINFKLPTIRLNGILWGKRTVELIGKCEYFDHKHDLYCSVEFYEKPNIFSKRLHPSDYFEGQITNLSNKLVVRSKVKGYWLDYIEWDDERYWDINKINPTPLIKDEFPLNSDSRFREDLIYLSQNNQEKAQEHKVRLEIIQRKDRKLRAEYADSNNLKHH